MTRSRRTPSDASLPSDGIESRVQRVLDDIDRHTDYGGIYYSVEQSHPVLVGRGVCRFCSGCIQQNRLGMFCRNNACTGAIQGHAIGDVWYFRCWLGLDSIVVSIAPDNEIIGAIEVGGFFSPGETEKAQQTILSRLSSVDTHGALDAFISSLQAMREQNFKQVKGIADFLLEATFAAGLNDASSFAVRQRVNRQQQRLAIKVQQLQEEPPTVRGLFSGLRDLTHALQDRDRHKVMKSLDDFLGHALLTSGSELPKAKSAITLVLSTLFCDQMIRGSDWKAAHGLFERRLVELDGLQDIEEACLWVEDVVLKRLDAEERGQPNASSQTINERVVQWIRTHLRKRITITGAAHDLGISTSTLAHRLKAETGKTFSQHVNALRVREGKRLLADSNLSLGEISSRCGFNDHSYFTKVFRKHINLTPRAFRVMLDQSTRHH
ncbi:MAG: AraC family transcriptional regulator [Candidatus Pacebacteria bacterium]|nr:AraC family transcriptional regulator [Candidatus Paceibacterota bacterium]